MTTSELERLIGLVADDGSDAAETRQALDVLLARYPERGVDLALDLLSRPPRYKPSRGLLVDPDGATYRRWERRVAAAAALLSSRAGDGVRDEVRAELADDRDFAADVTAALR